MADRQRINNVLGRLCPANGPGLVAGIFRGGTLIDSFTFGYADIERQVPITLETSFHVASLSKQFTAYAIALLSSRGLLSLDQAVKSVLNNLQIDERIKIRHLVYHTSGLRDQWDTLSLMGWRPGDPISTDDILRFVVPLTSLNHEPGTKYLYCNTGYTLMAEIVQKLSGLTLGDFLAREVFQPLGLTGTRFREDYRRTLPNEAFCYARKEEPFLCTTPPFQTAGASSLQTNLPDFAKWTDFLHRIEDRTLWQRMHERGHLDSGAEIPYGFARVIGILGNEPILSHSGIDYNFSAHFIQLPGQNIGAAIFSNGTHLALEALTAWLLAHYAFFDLAMSADLERLIGFYPSPCIEKLTEQWETVAPFGNTDAGDLRIVQRSGSKTRIVGTMPVSLHHLSGNDYVVEGALTRYAIDPDLHSLRIVSSSSGLDLILPRLDTSLAGDRKSNTGLYRSDELDSAHKITEDAGKLFWHRPRLAPKPLGRVDGSFFWSEGFLLIFDKDRLTISHPRAKGFKFKRAD